MDNDEFVSTEQWKQDWASTGGSGFHLGEINGILKKYLDRMLGGRSGVSFLFPFCGKAIDMKWLSDMGHTVVGVECAEQALEEFFTEQQVEYTTESKESFTLYTSADGRLRMYCGNFYDFSSTLEGQFDIIWDRGGFNAVNKEEQSKYVNLMLTLMKPECQYYLLSFDMDEKVPENKAKIDEWGLLTDEKIIGFFSDKCELELRAEFIAGEKYNGSLCTGTGLEDLMEKLTIITLKK